MLNATDSDKFYQILKCLLTKTLKNVAIILWKVHQSKESFLYLKMLKYFAGNIIVQILSDCFLATFIGWISCTVSYVGLFAILLPTSESNHKEKVFRLSFTGDE